LLTDLKSTLRNKLKKSEKLLHFFYYWCSILANQIIFTEKGKAVEKRWRKTIGATVGFPLGQPVAVE